jgi:catechol 2,3-dioxygenase-like lactoylglutathione lyase family enzyme
MDDACDERPARPGLYCTELRTGRWSEMVDWYRNAVGLRVLVRVVDDRYALLAAGSGRLAIVENKVDERSLAPPGCESRVALVFEVDDLEACRTRLAACGGADMRRRVHAEGFEELSTADPDGNRVRLIVWPRGENQGASR